MKDFSVIIPVYKSTDSLNIIEDQLSDVFKSLDKTYDIILVNDSPNFLPTSKTISELKKKNNAIKSIKMRKNYGQQFAILVGLSFADGKYVITMDDDLQHPSSEIIKMAEHIENKNIDAVLAIPKKGRKKHHWFRNFGSWTISIIDHYFLGTPQGIRKSPFRLMKHDIVKSMLRNYNSTPVISGLLFQITHNVDNVYVEHNPRQFGDSSYSFIKLLGLLLNNIVHYSSFPLRILGVFGFIILLSSILFIITTIIRKLFFSVDYPGYASTVILISFFGGLNLFGIGVIGEYLFRIINEQSKINLEDLFIEH